MCVSTPHSEEVVTNEIDSDSRYRLLEDGTLMIAQTQNEDQGAYECVARNDLGETKATAVELRYQGQQGEQILPTDTKH